MTNTHRTPTGGTVDRSKTISFTFNGKSYQGHAGDTLASALLANGVHLVGRSFKYHRPRGILSAGSEEPNALIQLERGAHTEPNLRATQIEIYEGLTASSQNAWPSVEFDVGAVNNLFSKIFVAGFYYKTFMHPQSMWMRVYEPIIRRAAGLGKSPQEADPDIYDKMHAHCEVLVVGAGPAGLAAALEAARGGARVILADEQPRFGGSLLGSRGETIDGMPALEWVAKAEAELRSHPEVTLLPRTTVTGYFDHNYLVMAERRTDHLPRGSKPGVSRQRLWKVRAAQVVLATGSHERPLVFADNDRPGVMLAGAARTYVNQFGVLPGRRVVVFTNNDSAYQAALDLHDSGAAVPAIIDLRKSVDGPLARKARAQGIRIITNSAISEVEGGKKVRGVQVQALAADGETVTGPAESIACDLIAMSGGWNPAVHLFSQSMGKLRYDEALAAFVPNLSVQAERSAGACKGSFALPACLAEGAEAGRAALAAAGLDAAEPARVPTAEALEEQPLRPLWIVPGKKPVGQKGKHFVDYQNDVTAADVLLASREGYQSVEHLKRYTTTGMGTDQGKTSNVNALAILAKSLASPIPQVGTTTFRPPYTPLTYGTIAGRDVGELADVARVTPIHAWHVEQGAVFEDVGQWKRPWYFPRGAETMEEAVRRECRAVRTSVGVLDASTLGKIDIQGPDAATFLNRMYTNAWLKLDIGRCRYGVMCKEDGMIMDDGVTTRLGPNHFIMTTTTGNAAKVLDWLEEYLQTEWPELKVYLTSVTEQWSTASIAGPKAREVVAALAPDLDLSAEAFPFMSMKEAVVAGVPARIFRISFTGELSYEINVPSHQALHVWREMMRVGARYDITPYGTETMHVLRAEKGYIIVGQETDGTVTPFDLGMDWIVSKQKKDFVGKRSYARPGAVDDGRKQLVGLLPEDPAFVLQEGAQIVEDADNRTPIPMLGHVTSSYYSETLGRSFALALIKNGTNRLDQAVYAPLDGGRIVKCTVTKPVFFDPEGVRLHG
ncbi:sarcosine oxidase subunit alpha [Azospirillum sp. SYSU D00513]|uniref:sarcosine oxidase subunit alpha n=1 Tax=Azospirillum sp. SYSU D00513 TaxID=2812561 RepID=UPI001A968443|nr:sarcosine oxidase subunit alpha [Azospirillum sp. SYSU D00513]